MKSVTFDTIMKKKNIKLKPWQKDAADALLSVMHNQKGVKTGKTFLLQQLNEFVSNYGNEFDIDQTHIKPKVVTICGSSRFVEEMAVCAWLIERDENAIAMGLHLLPRWYSTDLPDDHLAEFEGVADSMDDLHLKKIDISDEIFVVNNHGYIGESTSREIEHAKRRGIPVRYFESEEIGATVHRFIEAEIERNNAYMWSEDLLRKFFDANVITGRDGIYTRITDVHACLKGWWLSVVGDQYYPTIKRLSNFLTGHGIRKVKRDGMIVCKDIELKKF